MGDICDSDDDDDGVDDDDDNCPIDANLSQEDVNENGIGDTCEEGFELLAQQGGGDCSVVGVDGQSRGWPAALVLLGLGVVCVRRRRRASRSATL